MGTTRPGTSSPRCSPRRTANHLLGVARLPHSRVSPLFIPTYIQRILRAAGQIQNKEVLRLPIDAIARTRFVEILGLLLHPRSVTGCIKKLVCDTMFDRHYQTTIVYKPLI